MDDTPLEPHQRVVGDRRTSLAAEMAERYNNGASIRAIAKLYDRSYGGVHRMLIEAGVDLRTRGGNQTKGRRGLSGEQRYEYSQRLREHRTFRRRARA